MQLEIQDSGSIRIIRPRLQRIDALVAIQFKDEMRKIADDSPGRVVLDLTDVDFLDSSGLGALVAAKKLLAPRSELELAGLSGTVEKVIRLTRMDSVFRIHAHAPNQPA